MPTTVCGKENNRAETANTKNTLVHINGNNSDENSREIFQSGLLQPNHDES